MSQTSIFIQGAKDLYFADESDILTVGSTDLATAIDVSVKVDDETIAEFSVDTYNGLAIIPIGEILRSCGRRNKSEGSFVKMTASQGDATASHTARCLFCRRFATEAEEVFTNWLSYGPQERTTYDDAAEVLPFLSDPDAISHNAMIQIVFDDNSVRTMTFADLRGKTGDGLDVSPVAIRSFARNLMLYTPIKSYALWIERVDSRGETTTGTPVKFKVSRDRLERVTYKFVNPKGGWEYIHASGDLKRSIETETGTFVTSGVETELSNDFTKTMEQNSGHIGGAAEAEFWLGFLASKERYVRETDGRERLIVITDSSPSVTDLKVGELSFTWHYSNKHDTIINRVSIPVESIEIVGDDTVDNDDNQAQLGILYNPAATTQRGVVWQLVSGSAFATLSATGVLSVKEGAQGSPVVVKAVSSHNGDIQDTKTILVTYHAEAAASYGLTVNTNVDTPTIELEIDGTAVGYFDGILVSEGQAVRITVSKSGYATQSRSFAFAYSEKDQYFELVEDISVTFAHADYVGPAAQNVPITVSDPLGKGWGISYQMSQYYGYVTGAGVTSGEASVSGTTITGTGDAIVYLSLSANTEVNSRQLGDTRNPIYIKLSADGSWESGLWFSQLGTSSQTTPVTSVTLNKTALSLAAGASETLVATVKPDAATNKALAWSTSNAQVATVTQTGKITAKGAGTAVITATATDGSGKKAQCTVTVTAASVAVTGVSLNKTALTLRVGGTAQLSASVTPSNATNKSVSWKSSATGKASVSQSGLVTGVAEGTATITVTTSDGGFKATCDVTVVAGDDPEPGSISVGDITIAAAQTSASADLSCVNMDIATLTATTTSAWLQGITVDTTGSTPRVRLSFARNHTTEARSAVVKITGTGTDGNPVSTQFTATQKGASSSDVPCTGMSISGDAEIHNSGNTAEYTVSFTPAATTQAGVVWSVSGPASITPNGTRCQVTLDPDADDSEIVLVATNSYNGNISARKTITGTYIHNPGNITVTPSSVTVDHLATSDNSPVISTTNILDGTLVVKSVTGFISSAEIQSGKLVTSFAANTGSGERTGTVLLRGHDLNGGIVEFTVSYRQTAEPAPEQTMGITALAATPSGGKLRFDFRVVYGNQSPSESIILAPAYTLSIIGSDGTAKRTVSGTLPDKTIAGLATEVEIYSVSITASQAPGDTYRVTLNAGTLTDTYAGDGTDVIEQ